MARFFEFADWGGSQGELADLAYGSAAMPRGAIDAEGGSEQMQTTGKRQRFIRRLGMAAAVCALATFSSGFAASGAQSGRPPNFLVILADDLGAKELACYGNPEHRTPNLDNLAQGGVMFQTCFATPLCHPTRFEIMTGQYGCHNGIYNFSGKRGGPEPGAPQENIAHHFTFAQLLKPVGYATALVGKWQLSGSQPTLIHEAGFDEYCAWGYRNYFAGEELEKTIRDKVDYRSRYWRPSVIQNGKYAPTTVNDYGPDMHADFLIDFMKRKQGQPFFIYHTMCLVHGPWVPTPDSVRSDEEKFKAGKENLQADIEYMDKLVGRIVKALDDLGLRDNTIVFFTGDNGTGGDGKAEGTEKGARVPLIVNCPGLVKARGPVDDLADLSDIVPTLAELAGAELPKDRPIDGRSIAPVLRGAQGTRDWSFSYIADRRILRDKRWLLEDNSFLSPGRFFDCGDSRNGAGYKDVTDSKDPEALAARARFEKILESLPSPKIETPGAPNEAKPGEKKEKKTVTKAEKGKGETADRSAERKRANR